MGGSSGWLMPRYTYIGQGQVYKAYSQWENKLENILVMHDCFHRDWRVRYVNGTLKVPRCVLITPQITRCTVD